MATHLKSGDALSTWAVRRFAGEHSPVRIRWDPTNPAPCDSLRVAGRTDRIQIRAADPTGPHSFDELWADLVVELCEFERPSNDSQALLRFLDAEFSSEDYVRERLGLRDKAFERARVFYLTTYLPWARANNVPTSPDRWHCFDFDADTATRDARWRSSLLWSVARNWYQLNAVDAVLMTGQADEADRRLDALVSVRADFSAEQQALFHSLRGQVHLERSNAAAALEELEPARLLSPHCDIIARLHARAMLERGFRKLAGKIVDDLVREDPDNPRNYVLRSLIFADAEDWPMALADCNRAIALEPDEPLYYAHRARCDFEAKHFDQMAADIRQAIALNPGDLGQTYNLSTGNPIPPDALEHGRKQLRQMLIDRPAMAAFIDEGDVLWNWAARKFAGEDSGMLVDWDPLDPTPVRAKCSPGRDGKHGRIMVRNLETLTESKEAAFSALWSYAVFELHNVFHAGDPTELISKALAGQIEREQFILEMIHREKPALECVRAFYLELFLPYARSKGLVPSPGSWHCMTFYCDEFERQSFYRWLPHWGKYDLSYEHLQSWRREFESAVLAD